MNTKILLKSLKFSLLPTLITFSLLLLGFMSFENALAFLTAQTFWPIVVRILLFVAEIVLIFIMYKHYEEEEFRQNITTDDKKGDRISYSSYVGNLFDSFSSSRDELKVYKTKNSKLLLIEHIKNS